MTADIRSDRYRKAAEKELVQGNPRDPVLNESIEAAAENGSNVSEEYTGRRVEQMLSDEDERETVMIRRMKLHREIDDSQSSPLLRTLTLMAVIVAVVFVGYWLMKR